MYRFNPEIHHRRSIRLKRHDYSQAGAYFVTVCSQSRECLFGNVVDGKMELSSFGEIIAYYWKWLGFRYSHIALDKYVIMPNHIHAVVTIVDECKGGSRTAPTTSKMKKPLGRLLGAFKTVSTKRINELRGTPRMRVWQRNYHERIIRNDRELFQIQQYIDSNPSKWEEDENHPKN